MSCTAPAGCRAPERLLQGRAGAFDAGRPLLLTSVLTEAGLLQIHQICLRVGAKEGGGGMGGREGARNSIFYDLRGADFKPCFGLDMVCVHETGCEKRSTTNPTNC